MPEFILPESVFMARTEQIISNRRIKSYIKILQIAS